MEQYALSIKQREKWETCAKGNIEYLFDLLNDYATSCDSFKDSNIKFKITPIKSFPREEERIKEDTCVYCVDCHFGEQLFQSLIDGGDHQPPYPCNVCYPQYPGNSISINQRCRYTAI